MSKRFKGTSPMFINASRVKLPDCEVTADTIVQMLVEGYPDGFSQNNRGCDKCARPAKKERAA